MNLLAAIYNPGQNGQTIHPGQTTGDHHVTWFDMPPMPSDVRPNPARAMAMPSPNQHPGLPRTEIRAH